MPNPDSVWPDMLQDMLQDLLPVSRREGGRDAATTDSSDELGLVEQVPASNGALAPSSRVVH
jgi:hypothetical protein